MKVTENKSARKPITFALWEEKYPAPTYKGTCLEKKSRKEVPECRGMLQNDESKELWRKCGSNRTAEKDT
jgi:hypothetical protein